MLNKYYCDDAGEATNWCRFGTQQIFLQNIEIQIKLIHLK